MAKFHVRARTVDMLGRQQIAGIPTAISELFKNAHDAYARNVEADYFRDEDLLVLRDDGLGMTKEDFEKRWLTLGTDSKLGTVLGLPPPPKDPSQQIRPILGEKGIGRLAVAILGPQILVLSRAKRNGKLSTTLVGAYLNWNLFAQPGLDLDEIEIPVKEFPAESLPSGEDVREMVNEFSDVVRKLSDRLSEKTIRLLETEFKEFDINPSEICEDLGKPTLLDEGSGTHFFVKRVDRIIQEDIDAREDDSKATKFEKHLLGFTNTMTPEFNPPPIVARFRDYPDEGAPVELIGEAAFFTPEEYKDVDHHIIGRFDEYGQFRGTVGIYQTKPDVYVSSWEESDGKKTLCGPFDFSVAVIQGQSKDSLLAPEEFAKMTRKANRHGGIYVYRDGVRVQPYGDSDYDWLDIERRRTLGASYYFYSFRRMFGAIELTNEANDALKEKAGREGFIENRAYRQFKSILVNFFLQTAADFFREEGKYSEDWERNRAELQSQRSQNIRRRQEQRASKKKREFEQALDRFFDKIETDEYNKETKSILEEAKRHSNRILKSDRNNNEKARALIGVEKEGRNQLSKIRKGAMVAKPRGVGLTRELTNKWFAYVDESNRIESVIFEHAEEQIEDFITNIASESKISLKHSLRMDIAVRSRSGNALGTARQLKKTSEESVSKVAVLARSITKESFRAISETVEQVLQEWEKFNQSNTKIEVLSEKRREIEQRVDEVFKRERETLERLEQQFDSLERYWSKDGFDTLDLTEALEEELEELKSQRELDLEMAQIGMAVNIVSHEFEKTVKILRQGFRRMEAWAEANPSLAELYKNMRSAFEHLDGYLVLFTPLDRRLHSAKVDLTGKDIYEFLIDLFEQRLNRHNISLSATKKFQSFHLKGYPSTFFPVFANLLDNSIFWLQRVRNQRRLIQLDAVGEMLVVSDNGPGVSKRDSMNIFLPRFSRKPGGRGMGLHVSRATLRREGYDIHLSEERVGDDGGAMFKILKKKGEE